MVHAFLFVMFCVQLPELRPSSGVEFYLQELDTLLSEKESLELRQHEEGSFDMATVLKNLKGLRHTVDKREKNLVSVGRFGTLDVEPKNNPVFGRRVILPPEKKDKGRWWFSWLKIPVYPENLWMYGFSFKGHRTIRIQKVIAFFRDGTHKEFEDFEGEPNGKAFESDRWIPILFFQDKNGASQPKRLQAIHILGSTQDGLHASKLDFLFRIPDPKANYRHTALPGIDKLIEYAEEGKVSVLKRQYRKLKAELK